MSALLICIISNTPMVIVIVHRTFYYFLTGVLIGKLLPRLYKALVQAKLNYGYAVYVQTSPAYLRLLNPTQNKDLRIVIGTSRSSSKVSLEVEINVMPLLFDGNITCASYISAFRVSCPNLWPNLWFKYPSTLLTDLSHLLSVQSSISFASLCF